VYYFFLGYSYECTHQGIYLKAFSTLVHLI